MGVEQAAMQSIAGAVDTNDLAQSAEDHSTSGAEPNPVAQFAGDIYFCNGYIDNGFAADTCSASRYEADRCTAILACPTLFAPRRCASVRVK